MASNMMRRDVIEQILTERSPSSQPPSDPNQPPDPPKSSKSRSSLAVFNSAAYRLYFGGQLVSISGTWMQAAAQQVVVYNMTHQEIALGLTAVAQGLPALLLTPFAGVIVESIPRRKILLITQAIMMILAFLLAGLEFSGLLQLWHIIALSLSLGVVNAVDAPARQAFVIELVGHEDLASGIAMNAIMFNAARIIGPALGGLALATVGPAWCFLLNGLSFLAVLISLFLMKVKPIGQILTQVSSMRNVWRTMIEGFQFARNHTTILPLLLLATVTAVFGTTFSTLFAPFAQDVLKNVAIGTSALFTAQGIGTMIGSIWIARTSSAGYRGKMLVWASIVAPIAVIVLATSQSLAFALVVTGVAGLATILQFVVTNTLIQTVVPDEFRGRVISLYTLTIFGLNPFGSLALSAIAQITNIQTALVIFGGISLSAALLITIRAPGLRALR